MAPAEQKIDAQSWLMLLALSLLWGASFLFIGIAVKELSSLLIVLARVALAAAILLPAHLLLQGRLPGKASTWIAAGGMSLFNNVLPFTLIVYGQHYITAGLASVINATTPMFGAIIMALAGAEALTWRKSAGLMLGVAGVAILRGVSAADLGQETLGMLAVLVASMSYGASSLWAKRRLPGVPPLTTATCQLIISTVLMTILVLLFADPSAYRQVSPTTWAALGGLALFSTAIAYLLFFRIIARAGASVVLLVTMMIPVTAILLGHFGLGEVLKVNEIIGALVIGAALLVIDGRIFRRWAAQ